MDKVIRGNATKKDLLKLQMKVKGRRPQYYEQIAREEAVDFKMVEELVQVAVQERNVEAIKGLAELNRAAVASALQEETGFNLVQQAVEKGSDFAPEIFFLLRTVLQPHYKRLFKNFTKHVVLKESRKIAGRGLKGYHRQRTRYVQHKTILDVERTVQNIAGKPLEYMTADDFAGIEKTQKKRAGVLILDTSGSMYGRLIFNAALTTAVLSYHMKDNDHSIVVFNTDSDVIKKIDENTDIDGLIDTILEIQPSGYTNITAGLRKGRRQLDRAACPKKFAILVTDGNANRDESGIAREAAKYANLHVIGIPAETTAGERFMGGLETCKEIARLGGGMYVKVSRFKDIPRMLQRLLLKL